MARPARTVHFPRNPACIAKNAACVTVCPTGACFKRTEDGIVLVNEANCIGCKLCSWACPYGAREYDADRRRDEEVHVVHRPYLQREHGRGRPRPGVCVDVPGGRSSLRRSGRSQLCGVAIGEAERQGYDLMPEMGYKPTNKYLPPRPKSSDYEDDRPRQLKPIEPTVSGEDAGGLFRWLDKVLTR